MSDIERITPERVREKIQSGDALLVCAYDDDDKFERTRLDGSIALSEFRSGISAVPKDREIVFF